MARLRRERTIEGLLTPLLDLERGVDDTPVEANHFRERLVDRYFEAVSPTAKKKGGRAKPPPASTSARTALAYQSLTERQFTNGGDVALQSCSDLDEPWAQKARGVYVTRDELAELLNMKKGGAMSGRLFVLFDTRDEGRIPLLEFIQTCPLLCPITSIERKLRFIFRLYNKLDDGKLLRSEVIAMMKEGLEENRLKLKIPTEKVVDEVFAIVTGAHKRSRKRTTKLGDGSEEEFLYWKEFRRLIETQHEGTSFAQPAHKSSSVALLTKSNAYWTKETDFNVFLASTKDLNMREENRDRTLKKIQGSQDDEEEEESFAPARAKLKVSVRIGEDEYDDDEIPPTREPQDVKGKRKSVRFASRNGFDEDEGEKEATDKGKEASKDDEPSDAASSEDSEEYTKSIAPFEDALEKRWQAMSEHWRKALTASTASGESPDYLKVINARQGKESSKPVENTFSRDVAISRKSMNGDALLQAKGDDEIADFVDLLPSIHWNQNDYDVLLMQDSQNQHGLLWRIMNSMRNTFRMRRRLWTWLFIYFGINIFLLTFYFLYQRYYAPQFKLLGWSICVSRSTALVIEWNSFLLLMTVCRNVITWLRSGLLRRALPYDYNLEFHKIIACVIFVCGIAHTIGHGFNVYQLSHARSAKEINDARGEYRWYDFKSVPSVGTVMHSVPVVTGIGLWIVLLAIFITAFYKIRQKKFEVFWYTHHLFIFYYVMLSGHGMQMVLGDFPMAWIFVLIPCVLYGFERVGRSVRARRDTRVVSAQIWPTKVLNLVLRRPREFQYRAGEYAFIRIPEISYFQWHPFTLTSSPEEHTISFHIRAVGDWTTKVYNKLNFELSALQREDNKVQIPKNFLRVHVDGPYGAPSEDFYHYDRIIMIGAGIGVTPFVSILKDIKYKWARKAFAFDVKRAYFFWMVNDQESFSWFSDLLKDVMADDTDGIIKIRTYLTGALAHTDVRGFALWHILSLFYETQCIDAITGLPSRTYWGHPDWSDIFTSFKVVFRDRKVKRVGVFYCGPDALARDIKNASKACSCHKLTFSFHKEKF